MPFLIHEKLVVTFIILTTVTQLRTGSGKATNKRVTNDKIMNEYKKQMNKILCKNHKS